MAVIDLTGNPVGGIALDLDGVYVGQLTPTPFTVVIDGVALDLTHDTDGTFGLAYSWAPDDIADGFHADTFPAAIAEWVALAPEGHPTPWAGCYGCQGTGTLQGFGSRPGTACSCVTVEP